MIICTINTDELAVGCHNWSASHDLLLDHVYRITDPILMQNKIPVRSYRLQLKPHLLLQRLRSERRDYFLCMQRFHQKLIIAIKIPDWITHDFFRP